MADAAGNSRIFHNRIAPVAIHFRFRKWFQKPFPGGNNSDFGFRISACLIADLISLGNLLFKTVAALEIVKIV